MQTRPQKRVGLKHLPQQKVLDKNAPTNVNAYKVLTKETNTKRKFSQDYYDVLATFNKIAERYPILNKESERKMIEKYRNNRPKLNHLLFYHNIRIVLNIAKKYVQRAESPADLLMNGARGLMVATERFDLDKNIKFNTYATRWVFKYILMLFYSKSPITGLNQTSLNELFYYATEDETEMIDYLCDGNEGIAPSDVSTVIHGKGFMSDIDYTFFDKKSSNSPVHEYEEVSNTMLIHNVIDEISADPQFGDIDKDIIYNNMMNGNSSISAIALKYHVPSKEINKRKRKLISNFKTVLSKKYNVNSVSDLFNE